MMRERTTAIASSHSLITQNICSPNDEMHSIVIGMCPKDALSLVAIAITEFR
ncbi:MAG: hypothetical protein HY785_20760 [Oscillatoriophycideae cyanobacterium NC_groundwater_1537_Pr4_S-0.65um_50_18]|nr:hypothetical protein [Oscillatoriophycideae cyanobacterium NC_groundwater_1537_Pr4_S-0.65um_50_18]